MTSSSHILVPVKFISIMAQLIVCSVIYYSKSENIVYYSDISDPTAAESSYTDEHTLVW
jgi:hypothetical protein